MSYTNKKNRTNRIAGANGKPPSPRIAQHQINFIKTLLYLHYNIKTPQQARNALRNGKLGQDLERLRNQHGDILANLNMAIPSDVTLENWYNQA
ncbi:hypothetical protein [Histophilus somni]|uniref:hypothetical protein n=1 Tax=Histophilus somni TaxID=731 RepID=UPI000165FA10|nr:hypothetical protein [Histophilus somni]ACA31869.1 hypothetical protein HSM_0243 [Histophilus somni 2336]QQJ90521.1 hypothetical protein JFJ84_02595 [Histophilus somni]